ncbi:MAG: hypothetical protein AB7V36_12335 [Bacteroidales bacterium]
MTKSKVESWFLNIVQDNKKIQAHCRLKPVVTDNYVSLGQLTALRFLEWVCEHPGGVIALPTGKTPEFFIKWTQFYLANWSRELDKGILSEIGFKSGVKPDMKSLEFFQLDEFFPIDPSHERSFSHFINTFYLKGFGLDRRKAHLINTCDMPDRGNMNLCELFSDGDIDLSLRTRQVKSEKELHKKRAIQYIDQMCAEYEESIRKAGGIGFFLGGIGPDGHIAFNIRGSRHDSVTRLDHINYETQAAAASDLGGIENVRRKAVVTMGLQTITANPDCTAIIIAAGASKSQVVADAILNEPSPEFPATCLHKLPNARMFITRSAAAELIEEKFPASTTSVSAIKNKIQRGLDLPTGKVIMHTAPHHDDIELAYFPAIHHLVRSDKNENHFVYCTSGFTAVTNIYLASVLEATAAFLSSSDIQDKAAEIKLFDISSGNYDITGYLNGIAQQQKEIQLLHIACRMVRNVASHLNSRSWEKIKKFISSLAGIIQSLEPGSREPEEIHLAKGWVREFEAELAWAHFGLPDSYTHHMRLKFYSADIFPEYPNYNEDVLPIFNLMKKIKPDVITLAIDPEGSGPDTHYKSLMAISAAIDEYVKRTGRTDIRIWGYRNVWSHFKLGEVNTIIPVSLNSLAVLHNMFNTCFLSQRSASFPSYAFDGSFSELAQNIWVQQFNELRTILGDKFFYESPSRMLNRAYGAIYMSDMSYQEFTDYLVPLRRLLETKLLLEK